MVRGQDPMYTAYVNGARGRRGGAPVLLLDVLPALRIFLASAGALPSGARDPCNMPPCPVLFIEHIVALVLVVFGTAFGKPLEPLCHFKERVQGDRLALNEIVRPLSSIAQESVNAIVIDKDATLYHVWHTGQPFRSVARRHRRGIVRPRFHDEELTVNAHSRWSCSTNPSESSSDILTIFFSDGAFGTVEGGRITVEGF